MPGTAVVYAEHRARVLIAAYFIQNAFNWNVLNPAGAVGKRFGFVVANLHVYTSHLIRFRVKSFHLIRTFSSLSTKCTFDVLRLLCYNRTAKLLTMF